MTPMALTFPDETNTPHARAVRARTHAREALGVVAADGYPPDLTHAAEAELKLRYAQVEATLAVEARLEELADVTRHRR
jgi:hypothetical protein